MERKSIGVYKTNDLFLSIGLYNNDRIYVGLDTIDESFDDITVNLTDLCLPSDDYVFLNGNLDDELIDFLNKKNIIGETIETYRYNNGRFYMVSLNHDTLKEYSPDDYKQYEELKYGIDKQNEDIENER